MYTHIYAWQREEKKSVRFVDEDSRLFRDRYDINLDQQDIEAKRNDLIDLN